MGVKVDGGASKRIFIYFRVHDKQDLLGTVKIRRQGRACVSDLSALSSVVLELFHK